MRRVSKPAVHGIRYGSVVACIVICWILSAGSLLAEHPDNAPASREVVFGAFQGIYPNVSRTDGRLAFELFLKKTILKNGYPYVIKLDFIDQVTDIPNVIQRNGYHFVTLSSIDYFKYHDAIHLEPILIPSKTDEPTERLLFLVGKGQTLSTIRQGDERSLIIESGTSGDLSKIWVDTLLRGKGFPDSEQFFTKIQRVNKPGRAILPVFFNQADASVITQHALELAKELNPQIGRRIKPLYQSKGLVRHMICATDEVSQEDIEVLIRKSVEMGNNPDTHQAMTILQMKRFLPVYREDLVATEKLLSRHNKITTLYSK